MEVCNHEVDLLQSNGLISPILTPVTEEPPSLTATNSATDAGEQPVCFQPVATDEGVKKNVERETLPSQASKRHAQSTTDAGVVKDVRDETNEENSTVERLNAIPKLANISVLLPSPISENNPSNDRINLTVLKHEHIKTERKQGNSGNGVQTHIREEIKDNLTREMNSQPNGNTAKISPVQTERIIAAQKREEKPSRPKTLPRSLSVPFPLAKQVAGGERAKPRRLHSKSSAAPEVETVISTSRRNSQENISRLQPPVLPLPPLSIPTHLHLELSADGSSPFYIHRTQPTSLPYETSKVKFERLLNFLLLPPQLEQVLVFGTLTCLDAWLYIFTILPLRFLRAVFILLYWIVRSSISELCALPGYIFRGFGRLWRRSSQKGADSLTSDDPSIVNSDNIINTLCLDSQGAQLNTATAEKISKRSQLRAKLNREHRKKPSPLQASHKADILQGLIIIFSCAFLLRFDASRMYHAIRGQAAIKLYVIYNVLEVCDRLFSALGQDIMDCLFSSEILDRKPNGRSRIIRPFWMFLLALAYTVIHSMAFFYQVTTLNVAVNSYSNALLTLLMSNQFVEIKGAVFKKIEKENLFQLTCADVVERFQLWLMLLVIAMRNIVELGGFSASSGDFTAPSSGGVVSSNSTTGVPFRTFGILPQSFTLLPSSFPAQVFGPFLIVLGSEMLVDWLKHAYISKFNAITPSVYGRFLDVLAKDYYSNAFAEQNLTRRFGLPVVPLACLFIRASLQTYHMFLATNVSAPILSTSTSLSLGEEATTLPLITQIDFYFRSALGRSSWGAGTYSVTWLSSWATWTLDDLIAFTTMLVFFLALYLLLLVLKLCLGMVLLRFARDRFKDMRRRERQSYVQTDTKRVGGYGAVELGDERRRVIYEGDPVGLKAMQDRETKMREQEVKAKGGDRLDSVDRYSMVAKRIW